MLHFPGPRPEAAVWGLAHELCHEPSAISVALGGTAALGCPPAPVGGKPPLAGFLGLGNPAGEGCRDSREKWRCASLSRKPSSDKSWSSPGGLKWRPALACDPLGPDPAGKRIYLLQGVWPPRPPAQGRSGEGGGRGPHPETHLIKEKQRALVQAPPQPPPRPGWGRPWGSELSGPAGGH